MLVYNGTGSVLDAEGNAHPLNIVWMWDPSDPFAVTLTLQEAYGAREVVPWTFARDLLSEAFYEPRATRPMGDVSIRMRAPGAMILDLCSSEGHCTIVADPRPAARLIVDTQTRLAEAVAAQDSRLDGELEALLAGEGGS